MSSNEIAYLFRFRDLVQETIPQHREVIREHGECWWGWWKRPSEDSRLDVWGSLHDEAKPDKPVAIGLFDSGTGNVYRAWVTQVIEPNEDAQTRYERPVVPEDEQELIPHYYRESPFSRAWMKINKIEDPFEFFDQYSFVEAPKLPNYAPSVLSRFKAKVVLEQQELTGMDTTIWHVRPRKADDNDEKIVLANSALPSPISSDVVKCQSNLILHLTDLHFAKDDHRDQHAWRLESENGDHATLVEAITHAVNDQTIGAVIVTGDLTFKGAREEFDEARVSLTRLLGILNLDVDRLVVVPGNHDIRWTKDESYSEDAKVTQASKEAKENYARFYRATFRHEPEAHLGMGRRFALPCGHTIEVCALNSSSLQTGAKFLAGMGKIDELSFTAVANDLQWTDENTAALRFLAIHHHLALTEDLEPSDGYYKGFGMAVDAARIQRAAVKRGVHLAVHGHKHRSFIWRSSVSELPEHSQPDQSSRALSIVGGGSAGSTDVESASHYFNIIELSPSELRLKIMRARNLGSFEEMANRKASLRLDGTTNRIELGHWEPA